MLATIQKTAWGLGAAVFGLTALACGGDFGQTDDHHTDGPPLAYDSYEVLFTNPVCRHYAYSDHQDVTSVAGAKLLAKPQGAFCTSADREASGTQPSSPQFRLAEWIADPSTEEVFFSAMSFSNGVITQALCEAIETRSVKVRFALDENTNRSRADQLLKCAPASGDPADAPELMLRGHQGNIKLQHNKLVLINPGAPTTRIAFGSGNISSGLVLHHENWHFITLPSSSYFAQAHLCLMNGLIDHATSKGAFSAYIRECRQAIDAPEEGDMKALFVPGEGGRATQYLLSGIEKAEQIAIAAHRFTHGTLVSRLASELDGSEAPTVRIVVDDDLYWAGHGQQTGGNEAFEYDRVSSLVERGARVRYVESNHDAHLLHHNKFMLFTMPPGHKNSVFCGAGNFTKSGMRDNFENFYYVTVPEVVARFEEQYEHLFSTLGTEALDMPSENIMPPQD
jgi:hypothetical protein